MKKIVLFSMILIMVWLGGCASSSTEYTYLYQGENELWSAQLRHYVTEKQIEKQTGIEDGFEYSELFVLTYKNDISELSSVDRFKFTYAVNNRSTSSETWGPPSHNPMTHKSGHTESKDTDPVNSEILDENDVITVTVEIDGAAQSFDLVCVGY